MDQSELNRSAKAYEERSDYDQENLLSFEWYAERITSLSPSGDLLELGIGHGVPTKIFSSVYSRHVIIEGSERVIHSFRQSALFLENIEIIHCLFEEYDRDDLFDVIVMGFVLEHLMDPGLILQRFQKFLKPGGKLYVIVPNAKSLHRRIGFEAGLLKDIYEFNEYDRLAGHKQYFDNDSIRKLVEDTGYRITKMEGLFLKPITSHQMKSLKLSKEVMRAMLKIGMKYPELCNSVLMEAMTNNSKIG